MDSLPSLDFQPPPLLSAAEALAYEAELLPNPSAVAAAMHAAGRATGEAILKDFQYYAALPLAPQVLVILGKGHNSGDAVIAAQTILKARPGGKLYLLNAFKAADFKPLLAKAYEKLLEAAAGHVEVVDFPDSVTPAALEALLQKALKTQKHFDISIDGLLGVSFRPPLPERLQSVVSAINNNTAYIRFRAAVDVPSGAHDGLIEEALRADFTYAVGVPKASLLKEASLPFTGRIRYLDLGFFNEKPYERKPQSDSYLVTKAVLEPLQRLRPAHTDKRSFGHLVIIGGSTTTPGAVLMAAQAALYAGVGLVTVAAPKPICPHYFSHLPEVMCIGLPTTEAGTLAEKAFLELEPFLAKATAVLMGPGISLHPESQAALAKWVQALNKPVILDAEALTPLILNVLCNRIHQACPVGLTPHQGEWKRLTGLLALDLPSLKAFCKQSNTTVLLKGSITRIATPESVLLSTLGGPVLARGGSGDILAGLAASLLAQSPHLPLQAIFAQAVAWQGEAADRLTLAQGERTAKATDLLDYLSPALAD